MRIQVLGKLQRLVEDTDPSLSILCSVKHRELNESEGVLLQFLVNTHHKAKFLVRIDAGQANVRCLYHLEAAKVFAHAQSSGDPGLNLHVTSTRSGERAENVVV